MPVNSFDNYPMSWKPDIKNLKPPIYKSLAELLEDDIKKGVLKPGDKLPPQRELADFLDLNLSTITRAFKLCEQKGLISGTIGKGTFIASDVHVSSILGCNTFPVDEYIEMGPVYPLYKQNSYVIDMTKKLFKTINMDNFLKYAEPQGLYSHRLTGQKYLKKYDVNVSPSNIVISSGSQNSLAIILMSLFNSGDKIAVAPLTYPGFKTLAKMLGIILVPIPQINNEIDFNSFISLCKNEKIKGIYLIPNLNNPTTYEMTYEEKSKVAHMAETLDLIIIEDGLYSYLDDDNYTSIFSLAPENCIYIGSISKSLCPGLRVSFNAACNKYINTITNGAYNMNIMTSPLNTEIICQLIETGLSSKIINERNKIAKARNQIIDKILKDKVVQANCYSPFRWLPLPSNVDSKFFENLALKHGVQVYCAYKFAAGNSIFSPGIRLSVCAPQNTAQLEKGLEILKSLIEQVN